MFKYYISEVEWGGRSRPSLILLMQGGLGVQNLEKLADVILERSLRVWKWPALIGKNYSVFGLNHRWGIQSNFCFMCKVMEKKIWEWKPRQSFNRQFTAIYLKLKILVHFMLFRNMFWNGHRPKDDSIGSKINLESSKLQLSFELYIPFLSA